ncbi:MAG: CoA protein activase [Bacillota bacterium]
MKVAFPLMGHLHIGLEACFNNLEIDYFENKPITKQTLELGTKFSPECACLPFKLNLGNFIEALENHADTLIFAGGFGPCRFGYYGQTQFAILKNLGYEFTHIIVEMVEKNQQDFLNKLKTLSNSKNILQVIQAVHFGYLKIKILDEAERKALHYRPREKNKGETCRLLNEIINEVYLAGSYIELYKLHMSLDKRFRDISLDKKRQPIKVGLVGEIYSLLEPRINLNLEKKLGYLGIELVKSIYLSDWIKENIFLDVLGLNNKALIKRFAAPYISRDIGGHCLENIGKANYFIKHGCEGIIQVAPLTCMPEIVSKGILNKSTGDYQIPFLSIFIDEQTGEAGLQTRLEAFADVLAATSTASRALL